MAKLAKVLRDHSDDIQAIFGGLEDVIISNNYQKALKPLLDFEKEHESYLKYQGLQNRLSNVKWTDADNFSDEKYLDYEDPEFKNSAGYMAYQKYYTDMLGKAGGGNASGSGESQPEKVLTYEDYVKSYPVLSADADRFYKNKRLTDEETKAAYYKKAGLTPEDIDFYDNYKPPFAELHNKRLTNLFSKYKNALTGDYVGDKYSQMFGDKISSLAMDPVKPKKYEVKIDNATGKVIYYDPENPGDIQTFDGFEPKQKEEEFDPYGVEKDADGKLYYYSNVLNPKTGQWEQKKLRDLTDQEIADYNTKQDKLNKTGVYAPKTGGRRRLGGSRTSGKKTDLSKYDDETSETDQQTATDIEDDSEFIDNKNNNYSINQDKIDDVVDDREDEGDLMDDLEDRIKDMQAAFDGNDRDSVKAMIDQAYKDLGDIYNDYDKEVMDRIYSYLDRYVASLKL